MWAESTQAPFVTNIILLRILVKNEFLILFIYRIVCQMHVFIVFIDFLRVKLRGKSGETFLKHIYP